MANRILGAIVALTAAAWAQDSQESRPTVVPLMREAFDLLDRFGTPDTCARRFVEVTRPKAGRFDPATVFGFLMDVSDETFTVWLLDLELVEYRWDRIYELRDHKGRQSGPARKLVDLGYAAVPRLIDALDDRRPTRTVGYWRDSIYSHYVLRVGDCAVAILEQIAGRQFLGRTRHASMIKAGAEHRVREEVLKWWAEVEARPPDSQAHPR
jgi:hypothetical protein